MKFEIARRRFRTIFLTPALAAIIMAWKVLPAAGLTVLWHRAEGRPTWTEEQLKNAVPYNLPELGGAPMAVPLEAEEGEPGFSPGGLPSFSEEEAGGGALPADIASPLGYSSPPPFTRFDNLDDYTTYPYSTVGKLFFTQGGTDYYCSAAVVGGYALWTAAHCLHTGSPGGWSTNVVFIPSWKVVGDVPVQPYGQWPAAKLAIPRPWRINRDHRYDFGGAVLQLQGGFRIGQRTGRLGFAWSQSPLRHWFLIGYSGGVAGAGNHQVICAASLADRDVSFAPPRPVGVGCDQAGGADGGPFILNFSGTASVTRYNLLNGNIAYRPLGADQEIFSPYFGTAAKAFLDALKAGRP